MGSRACIFCGATEGLDREHVLRKKWRDGLGMTGHIDMLVTHSYPWGTRREERFKSKHFDRQVRSVCSNCNGGWMRQLEDDVYEPVLGLALGTATSIPASAVPDITRWLVKTAYVVESMDDSANGSTGKHRRALMEGLIAPGTRWWAQALEPNDGERTRSTAMHMLNMQAGTYRLTTIHLHQVVFRVVTCFDGYAVGIASTHPPDALLGPSLEGATADILWPAVGPLPRTAVRDLHNLTLDRFQGK